MDNVELSQSTYLIGQCLGNYRLIRQLGQGGFATVYLGKHRYLGTFAAVKVLDAQLTPDELQRFIREARITARLAHQHIIRVLDFGKEDGIPFLVIEYAPYHTLRDHHPQGHRLAPATVVSYVKQVAAALQYIHDRGLIHQDVKPENMLLGEDHRVLLSDFGISVVAHRTRAVDRREVVGTVAYMAPEQIRGEPCMASDQYALGVVVYEWLTGRLPFEGSSFDVVRQHLHATPPPFRNVRSSLPRGVEQVVLKALAKTPEERFGSVREFAEALEQAYNHSLTAPRRPRSRRREEQAFLREAAGLLGASLVIGPALGIILSVLGLRLEIMLLFIVLCLMALPIIEMLVMHNNVAFLLTSGILVSAAFVGLVCHSLSVFLWTYGIASVISMLVTFSLGIQNERPRSRSGKK